MLSDKDVASLRKLQPLVGSSAVINLALLLCGARTAFIYDFQKHDHDSHETEAVAAVLTAFKNLRCIGDAVQTAPTFYDPKKADKAAVAVLKSKSSSNASVIKAQGRLLGYAGTAVFPHPDRIQIGVMCWDAKGRARHLTSYGAYPREVYAAMEAFQVFRAKAEAVVGARVGKGLVIKDFSLQIGPDGTKEVRIKER
jgi:hypothetical protein